ncbi:bifunctional glutamate N-acetyltransferase/amino-acid acetyltransferase ArgJ [Puniceicoccales bacterium CK1056]|uniref:Arginine biosynthesis bifunctional protein ArgJ n=1 Tax=Oceanipulchritudo coccoides TaxID=2706888 RepID=A0A6B2M3B9_9BACT|nr:bifunctional glutamate N-acetyltransferase/amino-acid acetyltransferase ArgJ [Oceanipulchritudo coccoides]
MDDFQIIEETSGLVDTPGFLATGVHCDIRNKADGRLDLALVVSETPCTVAGVFTQNKMAAAPVRLGREQLASGIAARGFVANSGNANACTGPEGLVDALKMRELAAAELGFKPEEVFVCSTGRIGERLPMDQIAKGLTDGKITLGTNSADGLKAAEAILTSDTYSKLVSVEVPTSRGTVRISGMAKGAGMIEPNMATMLAFICTDGQVGATDLQAVLSEAVDASFNAVTVDGDESTNDTALFLANGISGVELSPKSADWQAFKKAVAYVCHTLAMKIVGDGEKITKVVEISIEGAATEKEANMAARAIANSLLVKSSWYGNDPNWGRLMDALGYSGAQVSEETVELQYANAVKEPVAVFSKGRTFHENKPLWKEVVSAKTFSILFNLGQGNASCRVWSTDLTEGYVNFNKSE